MIQKLLIANRGEIACRIIRTCREMGIATVAVYSDADRHALHVELADEAIHLGGNPAAESYLNIEKIIAAAQRTAADAIHPGYGFLAENARFASAVIAAGLTFVGPTPQAIELMGNKRTAKEHLQGIPYVPGYIDHDQHDDTLHAAAERIGYPVMVKAAAGGGGKGMRLVSSATDLPDALASARREAQQAFGDDTLMLEKALIRPRHIEVQVIGDHYGQVIALGERECSIQRRHQKVVEETPAANLDPALRTAIHQSAVSVARQIDYTNAGTVEFLLDDEQNFYFMEMNTRLQVEHPVTETVYALDLVRWQIEIAQGTRLDALLPPFAAVDSFAFVPDGHAIEVRVYAEDPANDFLPVIGEILLWEAPQYVRTDAGIRSGDQISTYYDPMIAKVIAHGSDRTTAIRRLDYALAQLKLIGLRNNVAFLRRVLTDPDHVAGNISTHFLAEHPELMQEPDAQIPPAILIALAVAKSHGAAPWRNNINRPLRQKFEHGSTESTLYLSPTHNGYQVTLDATSYEVILNQQQDHDWILTIDGHRQRFTIVAAPDHDWWIQSTAGTYRLQWIDPLPVPRVLTETTGSLRAPMPGQIIQVLVETGQHIHKGDVLMIIEAMKMEHRIEAPYDGIVDIVRFGIGESVQQDEVLLAVHPDESD